MGDRILFQCRLLDDQEAVVIFFLDGHELEGYEGAAHFPLCEFVIQPIKDTGIVAADEEDFVPLHIEVVIDGICQHLRRSYKDVESLREQGDCRVQFGFNEQRYNDGNDLFLPFLLPLADSKFLFFLELSITGVP